MIERLTTTVELSGAAIGEGLRTVTIVPDGKVETTKGTFILDAESARAVIGQFQKHGVEMLLDWEHESLAGGRAPAAGWITQLFYEPGVGLRAKVRWNADAQEAIRNGLYAYLSPVVSIDKESRRLVGIHSVGLVNQPAIHNAERLAASVRDTEVLAFAEGSKAMELLRELKSVLGMEGEQTPEQVLQAVLERLKSAKEADTVSASVRERLGLKPDAASAEVLLSLDGRLVQTASRAVELEAEEIIREALSANKICAADKERINWLRGMALKDVVIAREVLANLPQWQVPGRTTGPNRESAERGREIRMAMSAFSDDARTSKLTSMRAFVDTALRDKNLAKLTDAELGQFSIAV